MTDEPSSERLDDLVEGAVRLLQEQLPAHWQASLVESGNPSQGKLLQITNRGTGGISAMLEVRPSFSPADARNLLGGPLATRLRQTSNQAIVVVTPYLSPRARELLTAQDIGYVDLSGNVRIDLYNLFVDIEKTTRNPSPRPAAKAGIRSPAGARIARVLIDATPPYGLTEIAEKAGTNPGNASRILASLNEQALITRQPRGPVTEVDWEALLRTRASAGALLDRRQATTYVAPTGAFTAIDTLRGFDSDDLWAVTGSFAAAMTRSVAQPAMLVIYTMVPSVIVRRLSLLQAAEGANVALVRPPGLGPFDRARRDGALVFAAVSQVAIDCLSGNDRMRAEGEALIEWMVEDESRWRTTIDQMPPPVKRAMLSTHRLS